MFSKVGTYGTGNNDQWYLVPSLQDLFKTVKTEVIFRFLEGSCAVQAFMKSL